MANLLIYNRAIRLFSFHPEWVDGCPGCPGPIDRLHQRLQGFLLRDIASQIKQPKLAEQVRQLGRTMVVKSSAKGEKSVVVQSFDDDPCPMNPNYWNDLLWRLFGGKVPVIPDPEPHPDWLITVPGYINELLMAHSLQLVATLMTDSTLATSTRELATQVRREAFDRGQIVLAN